ncbi:MAG: immunoglobulin domain-containing protein [Verrucomicrobiota bacterium]
MKLSITNQVEWTHATIQSFASRSLLLLLLLLPSAGSGGQSVGAWGENTYGELLLPEGLTQVVAVAGGWGHNLALNADGTVTAWGRYADELGYPDGETFLPPANLAGVKAIAAGGRHSLALLSDGTVVAWGDNTYYQTNVPSGLSNVVAIAGGWFNSTALQSDGTVVTWGTDTYGNVPAGLSNVVDIAEGEMHTLALKSDGTVVAWGNDTLGQTNVPSGLSDVVAIAAGRYHSLALRSDGTVVAWGQNVFGQTNVPAGLSDAVAIAAGAAHSLALRADGTVIGWGASQSNVNYGQALSPVGLAGVTAIGAGYYCSLAVAFQGPLGVVQNPQSQSVLVGSNITLSVAATGQGPLEYQWFINGQLLTNSSRISGATNADLLISDAQMGDSATYSVLVSNALGSILSSGAVLTVLSPPFYSGQPIQTNIPVGANVLFSLTAQGTAPIDYQWAFDGDAITGATNTPLSLTNLQLSQSGTYTLLASNLFGVALSPAIVLTVTNSPPYFEAQPGNQVAPIFGSAVFSVNVRSSQPVSYQWRFNGVDIPGATNSGLILGPLSYAQAGYYNLIVSNAWGQVSSAKAQLSVAQAIVSTNYLYGLNTNQAFLLQFTNLVQVTTSEGSASLGNLCALRADGTVVQEGPYAAPSLTGVAALAANGAALEMNGTVARWPYYSEPPTVTLGPSNVTAISGYGPGTSYLLLDSDGSVSVSYSSSLSVPVAGLSNIVGIAASYNNKNLAVRADGTVAEWIGSSTPTNIPQGISNVIAVAAASGGSLAVRADGTVAGWDGFTADPFPGASNIVAIAANPQSLLALTADGSVLSGGSSPLEFPCTFTNAIGIEADMYEPLGVVLLGDGAPVVTVQPGNQIVSLGGTVWLHARAVGVQPMSYQWQIDGTDISGATNADLVLTNLGTAEVANYQALVSNAIGSASTRVAQVTVSIPPSPYSLAQALNATNLVWTTSGNLPWFTETDITQDGVAAAQSGHISNSQESVLQTTVTGPGALTFWWKVSSEQDFDFLECFIDTTEIAAISGEVDWQQEIFPLASGLHTLKWIYIKDPSVSVGLDAGWLDQVAFTPTPNVVMLGAPRIQPGGVLDIGAYTTNGALWPWTSLNGLAIEASSDLIEWTPLTNVTVLQNGALSLSDPDATNSPARFYRLNRQ